MKKKGFTLIELLAVIVILGIILFIIIPVIGKIINDSGKKILATDEAQVSAAAENYFNDHFDFLPKSDGDSSFVKMSDLISGGYIKQVVSPADSTYSCKGYAVVINTNSVYSYKSYLDCGTIYKTTNYGVAGSGNYVQNGLLLNLDGYDDSVVLGGPIFTWPDTLGLNTVTMRGGMDYASHNTLDHSYTFDNNYFYMDFARPAGIGNNSISIEVVFSSTQGVGTSTSWYNGAGLVDSEMNGTNYDFGISLNANGSILAGNGRGPGNSDMTVNSADGYNDGLIHYVLFRLGKNSITELNIDGDQYYHTPNMGPYNPDSSGYQNGTLINIGKIQVATPPDRTFSGKIYAVRIYNKYLTNTESDSNYNIDRDRYGF